MTQFSAAYMLHHHYNGVIMSAMASQITSLTIVYSTIYSGADQRKLQSSASLAFVRGIHRVPVNSPHKWPVKREMFPFHDVIMPVFVPVMAWRLTVDKLNQWWPDSLLHIYVSIAHCVKTSYLLLWLLCCIQSCIHDKIKEMVENWLAKSRIKQTCN